MGMYSDMKYWTQLRDWLTAHQYSFDTNFGSLTSHNADIYILSMLILIVECRVSEAKTQSRNPSIKSVFDVGQGRKRNHSQVQEYEQGDK